MFDKDFSQIGCELDWNGDEGLKNFWGRYYRYPDAEFIQRSQAACMQQGPSNLRVMHRRVIAGSLNKQFARCLEKSPKTNNNKHESLAAATPSSTSHFRSALKTQHCPTQILQARATMTFSPSLACVALSFKPHWISIGMRPCACCVWVLLQVRT